MSIRSAALAAGLAGALACGGCAWIVSGQSQSLSIMSANEGVDLAGARCSLVNDKGTWYATTPGSVTVRRSFNDLVVECAAEGAPRGSAAVKSSTKAMAFGNILFRGVSGVGVGVDTVSGAAYDYPSVITVRMGRSLDAAAYASQAASQPAAPARPLAAARSAGRDHRKQVPAATGYA